MSIRPAFSSAQPTAAVSPGEEDEEDAPETPTSTQNTTDKPRFAFTTTNTPTVPSVEGEETVSGEHRTILTPTIKPTAQIIDGEEEEEETDQPAAKKTAHTEWEIQGKVSPVKQSELTATERRIRDSNELLRKLQAKKIATVFDSSRKELLQMSNSIDTGLRALQDTWSTTVQLSEKIATLNEKVSQLTPPCKINSAKA